MDSEKNQLTEKATKDAEKTTNLYGEGLDQKHLEILSNVLFRFSLFLLDRDLLGLTSATLDNAGAFLRSQIRALDRKSAALDRAVLGFFFRVRGDLRSDEKMPTLEEIEQRHFPAPARHFAKSITQANKASFMIRKAGITNSVGTQNTYRDSLKVFCDFILENRLGDLKNVTFDVINRFLALKEKTVGQKTCEKYKQAIQAYLRARGDLPADSYLPQVSSAKPQKLIHRAYTAKQVELIKQHLSESVVFSTELAYRCGLRAHELLTLRRADEKQADKRFHDDGREKKTPFKFADRDGIRYVVTGKGGLTREIRIPKQLAEQLENKRYPEPVVITDRGIRYQQHYEVVGGKRFTDCFRRASIRALGWSTGAHGLRHSYAQERMRELQHHCNYSLSKETVSQELGHFRPDITDAYLR